MHVAVDLDDVCMEFFSSVCKEVAIAFPAENLDPERMYQDTTDWHKNPVKDLTCFGKGRTWWDWLKDNKFLWATFLPVPGALAGVEQLRKQGHWVEALTSKPAWAEFVVWRWQNIWQFPFNTVTIVPTGTSKLEMSYADVLVDDRLSTCLEWQEARGPDSAILYKRPWNMQTEDVTLRKASSWEYVLDQVKRIDQLEGLLSHGR